MSSTEQGYKHEQVLVYLVLGFVILSKLYFFFSVGNQPVWWDEGDYLAIAKVWALGMDTPEWWSHFIGLRSLLLPLLWSLFFKLGLGEGFLRFVTLLVPSIGTVYVCYLLGKTLYSRAVGLISAVMMGTYWVWSFYSYRLLTDIPATFFGILCLYFFWQKYLKEQKASGLYLSILFGVLAFSTRFPFALVLISCALYLFFIRRFQMFKEKQVWKGAAWLALCLSPYLIYFILNKFFALRFYFGASAVTVHQKIGWHVLPMLFTLPELFWGSAVVLGILSLYPLLLYADVILKRKTEAFDSDVFVCIFLVVHLFFYVILIREGNDRWLLMLMPVLFIIAGKGLMWMHASIKPYSKAIALIVVLLFVLGGAYQNMTHASALINEKKESYKEVKLAGEWLKENTPADAKIITSSIVQNQYYSERASYDYHNNDSQMPQDCIDKFGKTNENQTCQQASESLFEAKRSLIRPDYIIVSLFEPVFTPAWVYSYPAQHNLTSVQAYFDPQNRPLLVIYKL